MAKKNLYDHIEQLIKLERESAEQNTLLLQEMIAHGEQNIQVLDRVADRLMDSMYGITGEGEEAYRLYLDYIETFNPSEAKERKEDLEYDLGYKTHILYAPNISKATKIAYNKIGINVATNINELISLIRRHKK